MRRSFSDMFNAQSRGHCRFMSSVSETTEILTEITQGDQRNVDRLMTKVYTELLRIASYYLAPEDPGNTLQPTALVHEAFVRMVDQRNVEWQGRAHFLAIAAQMMRRVLVDHARSKKRLKRGGGRQRLSLREDATISRERDADVLAVEEALTKLAELDPLQARIVEMRFFGGMTVDEVAEVLGLSKRSVERHWTVIRAWLRRELAEENSE